MSFRGLGDSQQTEVLNGIPEHVENLDIPAIAPDKESTTLEAGVLYVVQSGSPFHMKLHGVGTDVEMHDGTAFYCNGAQDYRISPKEGYTKLTVSREATGVSGTVRLFRMR